MFTCRRKALVLLFSFLSEWKTSLRKTACFVGVFRCKLRKSTNKGRNNSRTGGNEEVDKILSFLPFSLSLCPFFVGFYFLVCFKDEGR
jgi:hypothetical protein